MVFKQMVMEVWISLTRGQQEKIVSDIENKLGEDKELVSWEIVNPYLVKIKHRNKK